MREKILVVDDEPSICLLIRKMLERENMEVDTAASGEEALKKLDADAVAIVITDLKMPGMGGMELMESIRKTARRPEVIMLSGQGTIDMAVGAIKSGAFDFVTKPINCDRLLIIVRNALEKNALQRQVASLKSQVEETLKIENLVGSNLEMLKVFDTIRRVRDSEVNMLITGESGTGKELIARAIHNNSPRNAGPFMPVNCVALAESLLESELFGHEKGAFTGAVKRREGYFETACGGTVFLDEIGDLAPQLQAKLLRTVQERTIQRVGSSGLVPIDVRIICATNKNLPELVKEGAFREDLFYRLNVLSIELPPLRMRKDDLPRLIKFFIKKHSDKAAVQVTGIAPDAERMLNAYDWPGNVRELENVIQRAVALADSRVIRIEQLPAPLIAAAKNRDAISAFSTDSSYAAAKRCLIEAFEKEYIEKALERNGGNVTKSSEEMGMARPALQRVLKKHNISSRDFKSI